MTSSSGYRNQFRKRLMLALRKSIRSRKLSRKKSRRRRKRSSRVRRKSRKASRARSYSFRVKRSRSKKLHKKKHHVKKHSKKKHHKKHHKKKHSRKRRGGPFAKFVKRAYSGKVRGLHLKSLKGTKAHRRSAFKHNIKKIAAKYHSLHRKR